MNSLRPIPGVWYVDTENDGWYLYAPARPEDGTPTYPWWSNETQKWENDVPTDHLAVRFNPHLAARTEPTYRNQNFCPSCAKAMPDLPTDKSDSDQEEQF